MRRILLVTLSLFLINLGFGQNCPEPSIQKYRKVMNPALAEEYKECSTIIEAEYLKDGFMQNYRKPSKIKKMYFFQCTEIDGETKSAPITNETIGDFFVIDKTKADMVLDLNKRDKIKITGKTFIQNYFGIELGVFFIVENIEIIKN